MTPNTPNLRSDEITNDIIQCNYILHQETSNLRSVDEITEF